jgi:tRNA-dihydrouridine synthase
MRGFWKVIKRPVFVLAPLANVTDSAFRKVIAKYGKPDVMWTGTCSPRSDPADRVINLLLEFVSVEGLLHSPDSYKRLSIDLKYSEAERPIVAQVFGADPKKFKDIVPLIKSLGFDG